MKDESTQDKQFESLKQTENIDFFVLLREFLPLSLSDATMACGDPLITATLTHLPNSIESLATLGIAKSIAVFFESPIINILHASNALSSSLISRKLLWRFTLILGGSLSIILGTIGMPFIFPSLAQNILNISPKLAYNSQQIVLIMSLWPLTIAWRRYFQGLLIFGGKAKLIAYSSFFRLGILAAVLWLGLKNNTPGNLLAGTALILAVICETTLVTYFFYSTKSSKSTNRESFERQNNLPSSLVEITEFYLPLAGSMLLVWGGRFFLIAIIARSVDAELALATWPAAWGIVLVIANSTRMIQQIVIKYRHRVKDEMLLIFAAGIGIIFSALLLLIGGSQFSDLLLSSFVGNNQDLVSTIRPVILVGGFVPLLVATQNATQGFLVSEGKTSSVSLATWLGTTILLGLTGLGVWAKLPGALAAGIAMTVSIFCENLSLIWQYKNYQGTA